MIIDKILLSPYYWTLKIRHLLYDKGIKKHSRSMIPTVCIGNVTVGGTGKTPHTEMMLKLLQEDSQWRGKHLAVLSRGYKRESKGFQIVTTDGSAKRYGDEPVQIKKKFPEILVAVDKDRVEACKALAEPQSDSRGKVHSAAQLIILDDAFQYRTLEADVNIVLVNYNRPVFKDHLLPLGRLRDLPERIHQADIIIVSKCPSYLSEEEKNRWMQHLGRKDNVFFTTISYDEPVPVFPEGDSRYIHTPRIISFAGIANDRPMLRQLRDKYQIIKHLRFGDHHKFTKGNIRRIEKLAGQHPTAMLITTEKDGQRIRDCRKLISPDIYERLFMLPIKAEFLNQGDTATFMATVNGLLLPKSE